MLSPLWILKIDGNVINEHLPKLTPINHNILHPANLVWQDFPLILPLCLFRRYLGLVWFRTREQ